MGSIASHDANQNQSELVFAKLYKNWFGKFKKKVNFRRKKNLVGCNNLARLMLQQHSCMARYFPPETRPNVNDDCEKFG